MFRRNVVAYLQNCTVPQPGRPQFEEDSFVCSVWLGWTDHHLSRKTG